MVFQILTHLPAGDLLSVKLVSRRFYDLVNSPHAWMQAFSRYFPGSETLRSAANMDALNDDHAIVRSEKRAFTRLMPIASWSGEYLLRTKLIRCLNRGKPSLPFAAPIPGKPGRGTATFTFSARPYLSISHLHARFGQILDKRQPQFIHGLSSSGTVSSSDRRGKVDPWGQFDRLFFRHFSEIYAGDEPYGLGSGTFVGMPNVMDLSQTYGMLYGECMPGGDVYYQSVDEKRGRFLPQFLNISKPELGIPAVSQETQSTCAVWVAKSNSVPNATKGLIGMLSGSSTGVVTAYSLGSVGLREQRSARGELTARWLLSPGVPIIALAVDDCLNEERIGNKRIWAVAVNALGEVFYLDAIPIAAGFIAGSLEEIERNQEIRAWETGRRTPWRLLPYTVRTFRHEHDDKGAHKYLPKAVLEGSSITSSDLGSETRAMQPWVRKTPSAIMLDFDGWDMRRRLEVDFSGDDGQTAGENIIVIECGLEDDQAPVLKRYTRCRFTQKTETRVESAPSRLDSKIAGNKGDESIFNTASVSFSAKPGPLDNLNSATNPSSEFGTPEAYPPIEEWRSSTFSLGKYRSITLTTSATDMSSFALTTISEDDASRFSRSTKSHSAADAGSGPIADESSALKAPGGRARFLAVGSASGSIFLWNMRAPVSGSASLVNDIKPVRIIHTASLEISSLALSALYLVHGGSEGLVQAWDVLGSTLEPVRTLSSRSTLNARRRAVIAAQQNIGLQGPSATSYAAGAICLDPDPTVLRGVVAIGSWLRYWSYSSMHTESVSKSQKRRMRNSGRGVTGTPSENVVGVRRLGLKGFVAQEVHEHDLEARDRRAENKENQRVAGRFGLDLLGDGASEEEMLAYAKLLSEEEHEKKQVQAMQGGLKKDATEEEVFAYANALNEEDYQRWKFASWEERFGMPTSSSSTTTTAQSSKFGTPAKPQSQLDDDIAQAIKLSLGEPTTPEPSVPQTPAGEAMDDDLAEAIRSSLEAQGVASGIPRVGPSQSYSDVDRDMAEAIRLSMELNDDVVSSPETLKATSPEQSRKSSIRLDDTEDFPALGSSPVGSPAFGARSRKWKGKGRSGGWDM